MKDKVCIITGATSGMGKAIATRFVHEGARVIVNGRDQRRGEELVQELRSIQPDVYFYPGDVGLLETNQLLVEKTLEHFGRLDIVVTNAGFLGLGSVTKVSPDVWQKTLDVNLSALFYMARFAIPAMQKSGSGTIVVNSSIAAFKSFPNHAAYCASKAGLVALTKQIAMDYSPVIRINAVCPGPVDTPFIWDSAVAFPEPDKAVKAAGEKTLMQRLGKPDDIAELVLFLASEKSSWMTGSVITIDGGILAS